MLVFLGLTDSFHYVIYGVIFYGEQPSSVSIFVPAIYSFFKMLLGAAKLYPSVEPRIGNFIKGKVTNCCLRCRDWTKVDVERGCLGALPVRVVPLWLDSHHMHVMQPNPTQPRINPQMAVRPEKSRQTGL